MYCKIQFVVQNQDNTSQVFVIYLNGKTLKKNLLLNLVIKMIFFKKIGWYTFFPLYLWAKCDPSWTNFTAQKVI